MPTGRMPIHRMEGLEGQCYRDNQPEKDGQGGPFGEPADGSLPRGLRPPAARGTHKGVIFSWMRLLIVLALVALEAVKVLS